MNQAEKTKWVIDPALSEIHFKVKHLVISNITGGFVLTGDLTIRGTTKQVEMEGEFGGIVKDPYGITMAGFEMNGKINRKEFGLHWNAITEAGGIVVADEIKLMMNIELAKS